LNVVGAGALGPAVALEHHAAGNFSSKALMTSPGMAAPPETPTRRLTGPGPSRSMCSSRSTSSGTPEKIVQRCSRSLRHRLELEARDQHDRAAVAHAGVEHAGQPEHVEQRQHGDADVVVLEANSSPATVQFMYRLKWVSSAPLGLPVVPLV
jgi:hypothetical protein